MKKTIVWLRRDLRIEDNVALYHALSENKNVQLMFIFDKHILDKLENKHDRRVDFIHKTLQRLNSQLKEFQSAIWVFYGIPEEVFKNIISKHYIENVYTNHDYEPYTNERDSIINALLSNSNIVFKTFKDQCVFEKSEVVKDDGLPYTIFTPYSRKWKQRLNETSLSSYSCKEYYKNFSKEENSNSFPSMEEIGFQLTDIRAEIPVADQNTIINYKDNRDFPSIAGTSRLSMHLRFGTISVRKLAKWSQPLSETYLNEIIWRDFYMMILCHFPKVATTCFKKDYERIEWRNNEVEFKKWCEGKTGYPIVDAGMRELNTTGFMHNRVRMIVASFLTKHLLIDYRWGEAYFAEKLNDFDLSANNGGWQWAAGCGCDAAPYFRVFNPYEQTKKFDSEFKYIKKWVPEYGTSAYVKEIVEHKFARERFLATYKKALAEARNIV
jgi:deoxyribodipyrimidine photo-lyase